MSRAAAAMRTEAESPETKVALQLTMPVGPLGFEEYRRFSLLEESDGPICWLQSADEPLIALPAIEPFLVYPDYHFVLSDAEAASLKLEHPGDAAVLVILTARTDPPTVTANLVAPIVVNRERRLARQIVLTDTDYPMRYPVMTGGQTQGAARRSSKRRSN